MVNERPKLPPKPKNYLPLPPNIRKSLVRRTVSCTTTTDTSDQLKNLDVMKPPVRRSHSDDPRVQLTKYTAYNSGFDTLSSADKTPKKVQFTTDKIDLDKAK